MEPSQGRLLPASLVRVSDEENDAPIVGLWHVKFFAKDSAGIPDGTEVDAGYSVWHSDGTEILNSGRPPITGNFCLGTWKKIGYRRYALNHFALAWDPTGTVFMGINNIREEVVVGPLGDRYTGTFTIDIYDQNTNRVARIAGVIKGTRIEVDTPVESLH